MNDYVNAIPKVLEQFSNVLSKLSNESIVLSYTGNHCLVDGGKYSVEFKTVKIPSSVIPKPTQTCPDDVNGYYMVTRILLGTTILSDTENGYPFSDDEIKKLVNSNIWLYIEPIK